MSEGNQSNDGNNCESLNSTSGDSNENAKGADKGDKEKIDIYLRPTGNAPIMKHKKWSVEADKPIGWIIDFMRKYLKLDAQERLFLYINQTFAPSPDQTKPRIIVLQALAVLKQIPMIQGEKNPICHHHPMNLVMMLNSMYIRSNCEEFIRLL
ncbi:Ubiquitin-like autophagy protein Apg12 [Popillia japonica]|uniref:Ubiquitin-like protein ATG12 n=1 Tax=Popillia japonica TaxID=7064 RepID=A0AAW1IEG1_POPJA